MAALTYIASWAIVVCGFVCVLALLLLAVVVTWMQVLGRLKYWRTMLMLTSKALHGENHNRALVLPALKEWIGDSDAAAYSALQFIRRIRPKAEHCFDDVEVEEIEDMRP